MKRKLLVLAVLVVVLIASLPGLPNYEHLCPDSKPVIVDNKHVGCLNDKYTSDPVWIPSGKPAKLVPCAYCEAIQ